MSNKLNMSFLFVPNLVPYLIFSVNILGVRAWIVTGQFCWIRLHFKRKGRWQEGRGWTIIWRRGLFSIFPSKGGDYLREAINQGTAIIRGNRVVCPLNYKSSFFEHDRPIVLIVFSLFFKIIWLIIIRKGVMCFCYYSIVFCILFCIYFISFHWKVFLIIVMEMVL